MKPAGVLRNRNFALLWSGQAISVAGNGVFTIALPLEVLSKTNSPFILAVVVGCRTAVTVAFLLIGGVIVDRLSRRTVMLISDAACAISVGGAALLIVAGKMEIWHLILLSLIMGCTYAFFMPASTAIIPDILPAESLVDASSLSSLSQSLAQFLIGPAVGGIIVEVAGTGWAFGIDAVSFVLSTACLIAMRVSIKPGAPHKSILTEVSVGMRYARSQSWLWWTLIGLGIANVASFAPIVILEALLVKNVFRAGSLALGLLYAASGLGRSVAALYVKRYGAPDRRVVAMWIAWAAEGVCAAVLGLSPTIWLAAVLACAVGFGGSYGNVLWFPTLQERVPPELIGRVSSLDWLFSLALTPLGTMLGGAAAGAIGVRFTLVAGGVIAACIGIVLLLPGVLETSDEVLVTSHNSQ